MPINTQHIEDLLKERDSLLGRIQEIEKQIRHKPHKKKKSRFKCEAVEHPYVYHTRPSIIPTAQERTEVPFDLPSDAIYLKKGWERRQQSVSPR